MQTPIHDGHNDVAAAFAAGAVGAIISRPAQAATQAPLITVADTSKALQSLATAARKRSHARIIACTGHTGAHEMLRLMLNEVGETHAAGSGIDTCREMALALANLPESALYGVFELNLNRGDELGLVSHQLQPDVALIAVDNPAGPFNPLSTVESGGEIFIGMKPGGTVVLNRDAPHFARLTMAARAQGVKKILGFGRDAKADARWLEYNGKSGGSEIRAEILGHKIRYTLGAPGIYTALNSLGALCAAVAAGGNPEACAAALAHYKPVAERGIVRNIALTDGAFTLIDKTGESEAVDLRFAVRVLGQMKPGFGGQRMMALGNIAPYDGLADDIIESGIDCVYCCGERMSEFYGALPAGLRGGYAPDAAGLAPRLAETMEGGDIVTVKGAGMEVIVDRLKALDLATAAGRRMAG